MEVRDNRLFLGGVDTRNLIEEYSSPLFVYEEDVIRERARELLEVIELRQKEIKYSCKANTNIEILKILREEGLGIDAVSKGEIFAALEAGFDPRQILFTASSVSWDEVDYADVITLSGYGPSFGYSQEKWWAHYFPPPGRDKRIADATGFGFRWVQYKTPEEYWDALKESIDDGTPVRGPYGEGVLFIGYRDADRIEDRQVRPLARVFVEPGSWWTWEHFVDWHKKHSDGGWHGCHTGRVDTIPAEDSAVEVLRMMVEMATDDPRSHNPRFEGVIWGLPGIAAYADDLADMSKSGAKEEDGGYFQGGWRGCHNICPQMSGRPAAATYLNRIAPLFEADTKRHILAAAEHYAKATDAWHEFDRQLSRALEESGHDHTEAWQDPAHRKAGAAAVRQAHDHEKAAIAEIGKALRAVTVVSVEEE